MQRLQPTTVVEVIRMGIRAVVDRIESGMAVLLVGHEEKHVDFPISCLPGVREGSVLSIEISVNEEEEKRRRAKSAELLGELLNQRK